MLTNLPWTEVILATAAALAVLGIYDVYYVWPIHRRISGLTERCGGLERSFEQAIDCAEKGEETSRLRSCFGLTEGEADLVILLHGEASRRAAVEKFARRLIDTTPV